MTGCQFPRLQLRGSAGFSPASHLVVRTRVREPNDIEKEQNRTSSFRSVTGKRKCGQVFARLWHTRFVTKRPRDPNQRAKLVFDIASGEVEDTVGEGKKHPTSKGRAGGLKGGKSRAQHLTTEQRQDIARVAARARWKKSD